MTEKDNGLHLTNGILGNITEPKRLPNLSFPEMADEVVKMEKGMKKCLKKRRNRNKLSFTFRIEDIDMFISKIMG